MTRQQQYHKKLSNSRFSYAKAARQTYEWAVKQEKSNSNEAIDAMLQVSAYVTAPTLYAYVEWLMYDANKRNIKRLYFLARDGYQMLMVARLIQEKRGYSFDLRYLYCSRYALQVPAYHLREDFIDQICTGGKEVHLSQVLQRGGLTTGEVDGILYSQEMPYQGDCVLSYQQVRNLRESLVRNTYFCELVKQHSIKAYETCIGYLKQEGMFGAVSYAIVDSGWTGGMQSTLQKLLTSAGYSGRLEGYYFGLYELPKDMEPEKYHSFYFSCYGKRGRKMWFNNNVFELLFSSPEGITTGYQKQGGRYEPVFEASNKEAGFYEEQMQLIQRFCAEMEITSIENIGAEVLRKQLGKCIETVLKIFMTYPTREEVDYYGNMEFSDHVLESGACVMAQPMTQKELRANHVLSRYRGMQKGEYILTSFWLMGSLGRYECSSLEKWWHRIQILAYYYALYIKKDMIFKRNQ